MNLGQIGAGELPERLAIQIKLSDRTDLGASLFRFFHLNLDLYGLSGAEVPAGIRNARTDSDWVPPS